VTFNVVESEVIGLCIAVEALDAMVNHTLFDLYDGQTTGESEVRYKSEVHQQLLTVLLLDFVRENGKKALTGVDGSCLDVIEAVCMTRSFEHDGSVAGLETPVQTLRAWLNKKMAVSLWLPTFGFTANLSIQRLEFLFTSGNQSKHNLSRLTGVSERIVKILSDNGYLVTWEKVLLGLDDFRVHYDENYLAYYGTWLAEMLNNVRWGVQDYLAQQYELSLKPLEKGGYTYEYPKLVEHPIAREWYFRLMNRVRSGPCLKRFVGSGIFKSEGFPNDC
jgi:hypothetical protein